MNSPGVQRVTLIPMETILFSSENSHTEKQPFWKKLSLTLEIKLGPLFQGLVCPKLEAKDPQVMIFYQFYTIPRMNGPQRFEDIQLMINNSAHEFLTI